MIQRLLSHSSILLVVVILSCKNSTQLTAPDQPDSTLITYQKISYLSGRVIVGGTADPTSRQPSYFFEYGTTVAYGNQTPTRIPTPGLAVNMVDTLENLSQGATYHYRLVVSTDDGTARGGDQSFTMPMFFEIPSTSGTKWEYALSDILLYKPSAAGSYYDSTITTGIRTWQIVSKEEHPDSILLNIQWTGTDTVHFKSLTRHTPLWDSVWVDSTSYNQSSGTFTATITDDSVRFQFPEIDQLVRYDPSFDKLRSFRRIQFVASDSIVAGYGFEPGWSGVTTFLNQKGLIEFNARFRSGMSYLSLRHLNLKLQDFSPR